MISPSYGTAYKCYFEKSTAGLNWGLPNSLFKSRSRDLARDSGQRQLTSSKPNPCGLRFATVGAKRTSTGRSTHRAPSAPSRSVYLSGGLTPATETSLLPPAYRRRSSHTEIYRRSGQKQENPAAKAGFSLISVGCRNIYCDSPFRQPVTSGSTYLTDLLHR